MDTTQERAPVGAKKGRPSQAPSKEDIRVAIALLRNGNRGRIPKEWARRGYKAKKRTMQNYVVAIVRAMNYNSQTQFSGRAGGVAGSPTGTQDDPAALNEVYLLTRSILEESIRGASIVGHPQGRLETRSHSDGGGLLSAQLASQPGSTSPVPSIHLETYNSIENINMPAHAYAYSAPSQPVYPDHRYVSGQNAYQAPVMADHHYSYMGGAAANNTVPYGVDYGQSVQGYFSMEAHDQFNLAPRSYHYDPTYLNTSMPQSHAPGPSSYNTLSPTVQSNYHSLHTGGLRPPLSRIRTDLIQAQGGAPTYENNYALPPEPESDEAAQRSATEVFRLELDQMTEGHTNPAQQLPIQRGRVRGNTLTMNRTAPRNHRRNASAPFSIDSPMLRQLAHQNGSPVQQRRTPSRAQHPYRRHNRNSSSLTGSTNFDDPAAQPMFPQTSGSFNESLFPPGSAPFTPVSPGTSFGSYPSSQQRPTPASSGLPSSYEVVGSQGSNSVRRPDSQLPTSSSASSQRGPQFTGSVSQSATTYPMSIPETTRQSQATITASVQYSGSAGGRQPQQSTGLTPMVDAIDINPSYDNAFPCDLENGDSNLDLLFPDEMMDVPGWNNTYGAWTGN